MAKCPERVIMQTTIKLSGTHLWALRVLRVSRVPRYWWQEVLFGALVHHARDQDYVSFTILLKLFQSVWISIKLYSIR